MRKSLLVLLLAALLVSVFSISAAGTGTADGRDLTAVDEYIAGQMKEGHIPALSLGIIRDGEIVCLKGYGTDGDGGEVTGETVFSIASVSKTFTALAIRQLIEAGELEESTPVSQILEGFSPTYQGEEAVVTVGQLLSHTSGISDLSGGAPYLNNPKYSLPELVKKAAHVELNRPVGSSYEYSNLNYILLGRIVEIVSGVPYGDYVQENIFNPLGLMRTTADAEQAQEYGLIRGTIPVYGLSVPVGPTLSPSVASTGGIFTTAADLCRYMALYLEHENTDIYWMPQAFSDSPIFHNGSVAGYTSSMMIDYRSDIGVVVLANAFDQAGLYTATPTAWTIAEGVLTYMRTGEMPEGVTAQTNGLPLVTLILFVGGTAAYAVWSVRQFVRRRTAFGLGKKIIPIGVDLGVPILAAAVIPVYNDSTWRWLLMASPVINCLILGVIGVIFVMGIAKTAVFLGDCVHRKEAQ